MNSIFTFVYYLMCMYKGDLGKRGVINKTFLSLWYDSTWNRVQVSRLRNARSDHRAV